MLTCARADAEWRLTVLAKDCEGLGVGSAVQYAPWRTRSRGGAAASMFTQACIANRAPQKLASRGSYGSSGSQARKPVGRPTNGRTPAKIRTRTGTSSLRSRAVLFFLPCRLSTLRHWPKSRDHRRQNCSRVFPARPELPHHNNSAQVALPNASARNSPSVLTVQAHDENLPYPLLARRGKAILWKTAATAAAATVTASHSSMKRVSARTSPASSSPCLKRQVKSLGRRSRLLTSAHACLRLSLVDI